MHAYFDRRWIAAALIAVWMLYAPGHDAQAAQPPEKTPAVPDFDPDNFDPSQFDPSKIVEHGTDPATGQKAPSYEDQKRIVRPIQPDNVDRLLMYATMFVLALFVGGAMIAQAPPTLYSSLASATAMIGGITLIGAILAGGRNQPLVSGGLSLAAVALATFSIFAGFILTQRVLRTARQQKQAFAMHGAGNKHILIANADTFLDALSALALDHWLKLAYLVAIVFLAVGLKGMSQPRTAASGSACCVLGLLLAAAAAVCKLQHQDMPNLIWVVVGGVGLGTMLALFAFRAKIAGMPSMTALLGGFGGLASALIAGAALVEHVAESPNRQFMIGAVAAGIIGSAAFAGSLVARGRLADLGMFRRPWAVPGRCLVSLLLAAGAIALGVWLYQITRDDQWAMEEYIWIYVALCAAGWALGAFVVQGVGATDLPAMIALVNSGAGLAASATGLLIDNKILIVGGAVAAAAAVALARKMCRTANRSLYGVLCGPPVTGERQ